MQATRDEVAAALHPLEPLTGAEIEAAAALLKAEFETEQNRLLFVSISLQEPLKADVFGWPESGAVPREAFAVFRDLAARTTYEAIVSLDERRVRWSRTVPGAQPSITYEEALEADRAIKADPAWQAALRKRGVEHFDLCMVDAWSAGNYDADPNPAQRIVRALTWVRSDPTDNGYARPVEGLLTVFDLDERRVVEVEDHGVVPLPPRAGNYDAPRIRDANNVPSFPDGVRQDLKPVSITQPEGTSFSVEGHEVRWQKWRLRLGFTAREGLVLHTVAYEDRGRLRPVLYRASLSEMVVPYGDANPTHWRKNAFDEGEYGVGMLANALELGCDCLGEIRYFDAVVAGTRGEAITITNAICMHEEDYGILWKHRDQRAGTTEVRRNRRLVISSIATVGNYEYGFFWYLYQDGTIQYEIKMTGIVSTGAIAEGERPVYGTLIAPGLYGPNHQHFFNVRLDMSVDGPNNSVYEVSTETAPAEQNPHGNAWIVRRRLLAHEREAQRRLDLAAARYWEIANPNVPNAVGEPVAYRLMPGENAVPYALPEASISMRAGFMANHLWVTHFDPAERYAAGDYPNQHPGGDGLPAYAAQDRPLDNTDLVVWYSLGAHHIVRPEDWPVMPVSTLGFRLQPSGFFDGNPSLDVPPSAGHDACCEA
ncbi:MAG TPA: primary-amine oxidase [Dehalococcoidia bacterium]|nr:primary-amine oxidase [Dehalococcoidia bacterium]